MEAQIERLAVLDRGEAAVRVLLAVAELNRHSAAPPISTLVVHSDPVENSWYAREADGVLVLGPGLYEGDPSGRRRSHRLDVDALVGLLRGAGVDAVWIGHSVVADHLRLAEGCEAAGIALAGPPVATLRLIEDRVAFRRAVAAAGLPLVPWADDALADAGEALVVAARIGYPIRLLAGRGSGRRGITRVRRPADLPAAFALARERALDDGGDPTLLIEHDLGPARRVEVAVAVDDDEVVWTLDVRDTSLRRASQRVLLEAPCPGMPPALDAALRAAAVDVCRAVGYRNAGAVRFVIDPNGERFCVTGVDARLQLEHALTEEVCGIDLVATRLRLAAGGRLGAEPPPVAGHAIEARLLAQDPQAGFATTPGRVALLELPAEAGVRVDSGVRVGDLVSGEYEPLLATFTAWGRDRPEALARLRRAVERTSVVIENGVTDRSFLLSVLAADELQQGGWLDDGWLDGFVSQARQVQPADPVALLAAAVEAYDEDAALADAAFLARAARGRPPVPQDVGSRVLLHYRGRSYRMRVDRTAANAYRVTLDEGRLRIDLQCQRVNAYERRLVIAGRRHRLQTSRDGTTIRVDVDGAAHELTRADGVLVRAAGPAIVVSLAVQVGDAVRARELVAVLETMKMETPVYAPVDGVVTAVEVRANAQVDAGAALLRIRAQDDVAQDDATQSDATAGGLAWLSDLTSRQPVRPDDGEEVYRGLRSYLLGYDLDPAARDGLLAEHRRLTPSPAHEDALIDLYAELGALLQRDDLALYLQSLDPDRAGLSAAYRERLSAALGRYGVHDLRRTPELERSVVLLFRSVRRLHDFAPVIESILRRRLAEPAGSAGSAASTGLRERLDHLAAATQGRQQVVADLARDVRFQCLDGPVVAGIVAGVAARMDGHLRTLGPDDVQALIDCPQPLRGQLLRAWWNATDTRVRQGILEVYARRYYRIRDLGPVRMLECAGLPLAAVEYPRGEHTVHLVVGYAPLADLAQLSHAIADHLVAVPLDRWIVVDVVTWRPGERPSIEDTAAEVAVALDKCEFGRPLHRLDVTVTSSAGASPEHFRTQHLTFRHGSGAEGLVEETQYRNLHPMLAKRLSLWRLSNFAVRRLPSPEDIYLFHGVAHDNPKDTRLFALAEVRDLAEPMLERTGLQALAAMRHALAAYPGRERPVANRIVLSVRPPFTVPREQWRAVANTFAPLAAGAGLEKLVLRVHIPDGDRLREAVLHVEGVSGDGVTVREEPPGEEPIRPLTEYRQKVLLAERFGAPYPYEITRVLAPEPGTASPFPPGQFVEHELDGDELVPVDREPGHNTAHLVVGLITSYPQAIPEGMTRVAILSDPTMGLGNLAEPECRRVNAALRLAARLKVPVEWFAVSSGALIALDSGTENMDWIALTLRRIIEFTQGGGEINVVVTGINVGGQPYWNAEATMLMHTRGILVMTPAATMVLTGKQALDFSGAVSAEDNFGIGGYDRVMGPNGQAQYWAPSFAAACSILLHHYEHTYVVPGERFPRRRPSSDPVRRDIRSSPHARLPGSDFTVVGDVFDRNPDRKKPFDMRSVMRAVGDTDGAPLERWQRWRGAENAIVWDVRVGGIPVCMLGVESRTTPRRGHVPADGPLSWTSGTLFPQASRKFARAINATSGNRPLVVLANLSGFDGSPESMRRTELEYGAEIGRAVTNFRGPIAFVVVSRYHGGSFVVFSKALNSQLQIAAVEGSHASVIGGAPAAATVFAREVRLRTARDPRVLAARTAGSAVHEVTEAVRSQMLGEVADEFDRVHTIERALRVGSVDQIIAAREVRPWIVAALERGMAEDRVRSIDVDHCGRAWGAP